MRFFATILSGLALTSSVFAQTSAGGAATSAAGTSPTGSPSGPSTGTLAINDFPVTITYTAPSSAPVTIVLRKGNPGALDTISTLTTSSTGGSFTWTPASDLAPGSDYALEISQGGGAPNYSAQFGITGGTGSSSKSSATSESTSATSAPSSAPSSSSNGTQTSRSPTPTNSPSGSRTPSGSAPAATNVPGAGALSKASPVALFFGVLAAMIFFH
ncbi:hypothetical protein P152DRAFT_176787 [Eremomyces bilateralis CBS 781.70]|uniref:Yeast cell wall synthesis Kre9/Knh1-like N-terminal domain-containing protein n=1 Tax=Eremomyces bilateralis CBS 781.70 TaxID=1392243 RepID=A0A6G1FT80_9PEZI|nr:uncharacterized protein P152DRAFT_176787 [Eremomyces bilateralis CBS 781.70]KAF1808940.1 hypothetical protein P152DRAFT_176787 [Eremomyces bilateralis CBS 781.70]